MGISFVCSYLRENRRSLASFDCKDIAHLGVLKIERFCGGEVKIAAATAENRAIFVRSDATTCDERTAPNTSNLYCDAFSAPGL